MQSHANATGAVHHSRATELKAEDKQPLDRTCRRRSAVRSTQDIALGQDTMGKGELRQSGDAVNLS